MQAKYMPEPNSKSVHATMMINMSFFIATCSPCRSDDVDHYDELIKLS